jgi:hypothetical protein
MCPISCILSFAYVFRKNQSKSGALGNISKQAFFTMTSYVYYADPPSWRIIPCRLSATAYSVYSQVPSISRMPSPPSATWGRAMPWLQGTHLTWIYLLYYLYLGSEYIKRDTMRCIHAGRKNALVFSLTLLGIGNLVYVGYYLKWCC